MVQQTRRVVESYIFSKLKSSFPPESFIASGADIKNKKEIIKIFNQFSIPHNLSSIDVTVQTLASEFEKQYQETFPDLLQELRNATISDVDHVFSKITKDLFKLPLKPLNINDKENGNLSLIQTNTVDDSHVKWGHIIALLVFAGIVAVRSVECKSPETIDHIISWVTNFFDTELSCWLAKQGGWEKIVDWKSGSSSRAEEFDHNSFTSSVRSFVSVGVVAACVGFGALMMAKK